MSAPTIIVWDRLVRVFHWCLVVAFIVAWQSPTRSDLIHLWSGYGCAAIVALRLAWGFAGSHQARFAGFVRTPLATWRYLVALFSGSAQRHLGHNPLGAYMIVALLAAMTVVCLTGWMFTIDAYWGVEWVRTTHEVGTDVLVVLIGIHIAANIGMSIIHHENLIGAMWHGRKRQA